HKHVLTQVIGSILFAIFHLLGIVILMNMLVAIMSDSYSNIVGQSLIKWKFARTRIWLSYLYEGSTLPPPYNILPSSK
ncbi:hypothetical protein HELRODRAFT_127166, partial [Helobdella robusta]|uniref:Ion transport domain-containing protein n=1 Tax=Helobdella robusta TaxID=6412 RepID=T1EHD1_HELRO